ncbi:hypothetical protein FRC08_003156 [Ceratobasidium sp. 394]|nr:hypothetical protein FRC08_003156 [Ceratobasidium sp. 394]
MGYARWTEVLVTRSPEDWSQAARYSRWIRELRCLDGSLTNPLHQRVLAGFEHLYAVSIDAHGDVSHNEQNQFTYQDLIKALPPSLRRLEITRAHGPDIRIIATVKEFCPNLEELRLGRCTIFNSASACDFWHSFPFDHDSYMSSQDTDSYAHSLAQELYPLRSLKSLRLGLYLIPSTTVLAHRLYHRRNLPAPDVIEWQQAILQAQLPDLVPDIQVEPATTNQLISLLHDPDPKKINTNAETSANAILKESLPSLEKVQWMNWLSPGHLGLDSYTLLPPPAGF